MIDARTFANRYTAFWSISTPTCEHFVRRLNIQMYERIDTPLTDSSAKHRAFIAEFAFCLFVLASRSFREGRNEKEIRRCAEVDARKKLGAIEDHRVRIPAKLDDLEFSEMLKISKRLSSFFHCRDQLCVIKPFFSGCGFVDHSEGDVIRKNTLFEVKTVDRPFRSNDIKQLLVYCALNASSRQYFIDRVGVYNPRRGIAFEMDIEYLVREVAGRSATDLFDQISDAISSGAISR